LDAVFCNGGFLQLVNINFDPTFNDAIQLTQQAVQDVTQATNERPQALIQAETQQLQAIQFADFTIINANAVAAVILANATFTAAAINATLSAQLQAYVDISTELGLTQGQLINYISTQTIENAVNPIISVSSPAKFNF